MDRETCPDVPLHGLDVLEVLVILRRRAGLSRKEVAEMGGFSHRSVAYMESGVDNPGRLFAFWRDR